MNKFKQALRDFAANESGLSAVEYGLLAAGIAIGLWSVISDIGSSLHSIYTNVKTDIAGAAS
jgi:pilus assembly protein Flp/PilA